MCYESSRENKNSLLILSTSYEQSEPYGASTVGSTDSQSSWIPVKAGKKISSETEPEVQTSPQGVPTGANRTNLVDPWKDPKGFMKKASATKSGSQEQLW